MSYQSILYFIQTLDITITLFHPFDYKNGIGGSPEFLLPILLIWQPNNGHVNIKKKRKKSGESIPKPNRVVWQKLIDSQLGRLI